MNKTQLIEVLQNELDGHREQLAGSTSKKEATQVLAAICSALKIGLDDEGEVTLPGLGKFKTVTRPARTARNPQTGEAVQVPERTAIKFVASRTTKA